MADTGHGRLDHAMNQQRLELDLTWKEIAERAGMTEFHLQRIRAGKVRLTERAARKIDRAMGWEPDSAQATWDGGSPKVAKHEHSPPGVPPIPPGITVDPADWAAMTADERATYVRIFTGVRRRRQQASRGA